MFVVGFISFVCIFVFAFVFACCVTLAGLSTFKILHCFLLCFFHLPRYMS